MSDERVTTLVRVHVARYPASGLLDVYKLLHQATFGPGHLIPNKRAAREWLEQESTLLTPAFSEPLVESIHPENEIVRLHLRPYLARRGKLKLLVEAFVHTADVVEGDPQVMAARWRLFEMLCQPGGLFADRFALREARLLGMIRAKELWPAVHHSPDYQSAYQPAYRVLSRPEAESLCGKIGAPFEIV
jgi:hypothetical protein